MSSFDSSCSSGIRKCVLANFRLRLKSSECGLKLLLSPLVALVSVAFPSTRLCWQFSNARIVRNIALSFEGLCISSSDDCKMFSEEQISSCTEFINRLNTIERWKHPVNCWCYEFDFNLIRNFREKLKLHRKLVALKFLLGKWHSNVNGMKVVLKLGLWSSNLMRRSNVGFELEMKAGSPTTNSRENKRIKKCNIYLINSNRSACREAKT